MTPTVRIPLQAQSLRVRLGVKDDTTGTYS